MGTEKQYLIDILSKYKGSGNEMEFGKRWKLRSRNKEKRNYVLSDYEDTNDADYHSESENSSYSTSSQEESDDDDGRIKKEPVPIDMVLDDAPSDGQGNRIKIEYSPNVKIIDLSQYSGKHNVGMDEDNDYLMRPASNHSKLKIEGSSE